VLDEKRLFLMIALFLTRCVRLLVALANHTLTEVVRRRYLEDTVENMGVA